MEMFGILIASLVLICAAVFFGFALLGGHSAKLISGAAAAAFLNLAVGAAAVTYGQSATAAAAMIIVGAVIFAGAVYWILATQSSLLSELSDALQESLKEGEFSAGDKRLPIEAKRLIQKAVKLVAEGRQKKTGGGQNDYSELLGLTEETQNAINSFAAMLNQQAASIAQISTSIEEVRQVSDQTSENAQNIFETSEKAYEDASMSIQAKDLALGAVNAMLEQVTGMIEVIDQLQSKTKIVSEIIDSVSDISEQSNLLAVNAHIEAAKAGEYGRGFAVVAAEVKNLSNQSKEAANKVKSMLNEIQRVSVSLSDQSKRSSSAITTDAEIIKTNIQTIESLAETVNLNQTSTRQIMEAVKQQHSGIEQVVAAIRQLKDAAEDNIKNVERMRNNMAGIRESFVSLSNPGSY